MTVIIIFGAIFMFAVLDCGVEWVEKVQGARVVSVPLVEDIDVKLYAVSICLAPFRSTIDMNEETKRNKWLVNNYDTRQPM